MSCPSCGGENVKPVPFIYETGTTTSGSTTFGAGMAGGHIVPFLASSGGNSQTLLARRLRPPSQPDAPWLLMLLGVLAVICLMISLYCWYIGATSIPARDWQDGRIAGDNLALFRSFGVSGTMIAIPLLVVSCLGHIWSKKKYRAKLVQWQQYYALWQRSRVCLDCGHTFE